MRGGGGGGGGGCKQQLNNHGSGESKSECYLLTGKFGIVYKAELAMVGMHSSSITVAVKTLKG